MRAKTMAMLLLMSMSYLSYGQLSYKDAPRKTNTIVITKQGDDLTTLIEFAKHLQDNGFSIDKLDKDFLSLSTDFKDFKFAGVAVMKIVAFIRKKNNNVKIEIKGKIEISNPYGGQVPMDVCKCGMAGDARKNAFQEMLSIIDSYKFDSIEYFKK